MTQPTDVEAVAARLHEAREFLNLSPEFVSEQLELSVESLYEIEKGLRPATDAEVEQFAALYRLSVAFVHTGKDDAEVGEATERAFRRAADEFSERERTHVERFALFLQNFRRE
jgi:transcriptional regulator with XRE-family HTH domain